MVRSYNEYNAGRCRKKSASKQESVSKQDLAGKQYLVITNIMQIGLIRKYHKEKASN